MKENLIQEGKNLKERRKMLDNYEYVGPDIDKVLIVDDLVTTGSSILGVYKTVRPYAMKVKALSLAYKKKTLSL